MKIKILLFVVVLLVAIAMGFSAISPGQGNRSSAPAKAQPSLLSALPQSDAVALVQVRRLLDEAVPKIFANNATKLAEVNTELDRFKTRTGVDPRACDQIAVGMHYTYPSANVAKIDSVALARGKFDTNAIVAAGRAASKEKYREEKYQGHTIYVFVLDQPLRAFGLMSMNVHELAVASLNANTLALGKPDDVRRTIDASRGRGGLNQELIALATRDPNAVVGFGGNVTPALIQSLKLSNEAIVQDISSIRQVYGSVGTTEKDVEMFLAARTINADSAKNLGATLEGLKQLGAFVVNRMPAPKGSVARTALDSLKITADGNELQIRTAVAQADLGPLFGGE